MKVLAIAAAATLSSLLVLPTVSQARSLEAAQPVSARVSYGDLDLSTEAGLTKFQRRIEAAANRMCIGHAVYDLNQRAAVDDCVDRAMRSALPKAHLAIRGAHQAPTA